MTVTAEAALAPAESRRQRRKPLFYVICIGLMCLGAVVSAFAFTRASHSRQVVAVATTIHAGQTISAGDLKVIDVNSDTDLRTVPATQEAAIVGQVAQLDLAAGSIVTPDSFGTVSVPAKGEAIVGLSLTPAQMPASSLAIGDRVSLVAVGDDTGTSFAADTATIEGSVVSVSAPNVAADSTADPTAAGGDPQTGNTVVDVTVPATVAPGLAAKAANGKVALVLESRVQ